MKLFIILLLLGIGWQASAQSKILFSRSKGALNSGGTLDLMMYNPIDKKTTLVLKGTVRGRGEYHAVTSPDGSRILFNTYKFSGWKLGIGNFEDGKISNIRKLTNRKNYEYCGQFSPDSKKIVYQEFNWSDRSEGLFIADRDGSNVKPFFKNNVSDQNLSWTRDSKSIVFTHFKNNRLGLYLKSIDNEQLKPLSKSESNDFAPSISQTDNRVAFLSDRTGKIDLFVMDIDGGNLKNLTPDLKTVDAQANDLWAYAVSWSPDGEQIVFNAMIDGNLELFIVNADGTGLQQITENNDTDITPFWSKSKE